MQNELGKSLEDYLEAILMLQKQKGVCFSIDVANKLGFSKPSVSIAVKKLETEGYIRRDNNGIIYLTETGKAIADSTYEKHITLTTLFESLGVSKETAEKDACLIEHSLSEETFNAIKAHYSNKK